MLRPGSRTVRPLRPAQRGPARLAPLVLGLLAVLLALPVGQGAPAARLHPANGPFGSYSSGGVDVVFPSALPDVRLTAVGNQTITAELSVDQILEIAPSASSPHVVAVAFPSHLSSFNGSPSGGGSTLPISLTATLQVFPADAALWAGPGGTVTPAGPPLGEAQLAVRYSVPEAPGPSSGVLLEWTVTDWSWRSPSDLLGVQLGLTTPGGSGQTACAGTGALGATAPCRGTTLSAGDRLWGPSLTGLEGESARGPTASVAWAPTLTNASGGGARVTAGAFAQSGSLAHLVIAGAAGASPRIDGTVTFALVAASLPSPPFVLHGQLLSFAASTAGFLAAGGLGLLAYHRRNRRLERSL